MSNNPKIAIVIINWKRYDLTRNCIDSISKSSYQNFKIILIDNEYNNSELSIFFNNKKIHIIRNKKNKGFSKSNNQGINFAMSKKEFDYVILLNNDTLIKRDLLELLVKKSKKLNHQIIQPLILNYEGSKIWNAGGKTNNFFGTFKTLNKGKSFEKFKSKYHFIDWFTGCCVLIKTDVFKKVGYFDERFFAYYEDIDYSIRLKENGYSIVLMTDSYLQHYESASSKSTNQSEGNLSPYVHYLNIRNHILILKKHSKLFNSIGIIVYQLIKISSYLTYFLIRFRFNKFKMVLKGFIDAINFKK